MPRTLVPTLLLTTLLAALPTGPAAAQVEGVVIDEDDEPVEGVVVEAWSDTARVAARITGPEGVFAFGRPVSERALRLRAGRMGYRVLEVPLERDEGPYELRLERQPISIEGLLVESERRTCEVEDDLRARMLWDRMRQRYVGPMDTVGVATYLASRERLLDRGEIGLLQVPAEMLEQRGSSSQLRFSWGRQVKRNGYAFPVRRTDQGRSFDSWAYPPLEADFAPHFVSSLFGDLHRFRIADEGAFGWILEFCPRRTDEPAIRGTLRMGPDTTLISVEWLFQTPEPDEEAGGRAFFAHAAGPPEANWPLPTESIFWRQLPTEEFQEIHRRFEGWRVAQGDTVPFLPPRR